MKKYILRYVHLIVLNVIICIIIAAVNIILAFSMGNLSNGAIIQDITFLLQQGIICILCLVGIIILEISEIMVRSNFSRKCISDIKTDVYYNLLNTKMNEYKSKDESYYLNFLQNDIDQLHKEYFMNIGIIISNASKVIFSVLALLYVNYKIFITFMFISFLSPMVLKLFKAKLAKIRENYSDKNLAYLRRLKDFIQGFETIIHFSRNERYLELLIKDDKIFEDTRKKRDISDNSVTTIARGVGMISHICCMIAASYFIVKDSLAVGVLITSTQLLNFIFNPFNIVNSRLAIMRSTSSLVAKLIDILNLEKDSGQEIYGFGDIRFHNVTLSYKDNMVIEQFSYNFEEGKRYAIIGKSGIGKSTIAKAILKSMDLKEGTITIGSKSIDDIERVDLCKHVLYIPQNPYIFSDNVYENITLFENSHEVEKVIEKLNLSVEFLHKNDVENQGNALSGGEKQRISIARSLLQDPDIYIFDEPSSALDPDTSSMIEDVINKLENKTVIVITHNWDDKYLSTFHDIIDLNGMI